MLIPCTHSGRARVAHKMDDRPAYQPLGLQGSGKTHTMFGPDEVISDYASCDPAHYGIVPRAADHLFTGLEASDSESQFIVQCAYLEVYNNKLNDVLANQQNLAIREYKGKGLCVEGLTHEMVSSSEEVMDVISRGNRNRVTAAMAMNPRSSRGHGILTIFIKEICDNGSEKMAKLNLVDLAGMESTKKSFATSGSSNLAARREEASNINTSL